MTAPTNVELDALHELNVAAGLRCIERGLTVFPIAISWNPEKSKTNKRPLTGHGYKDAVAGADELTALVRREYGKVRGGEILACGTVPGSGGYVVFDGDSDNGKTGPEYLRDELKIPPHTYSPATASGGVHKWLRKREDVPVGNVSAWEKSGVDIRSDSGYVVCPGTSSPWGNWTDPDSPGWGTFAMVPERVWKILVGDSGGKSGGKSGPTSWRRYDPGTHDRLLPAPTVETLQWLTDPGRGDRRVDPATVSFCTENGCEPWLQVTRPGNKSGVSATVGKVSPGTLYVFSSNWPGLTSRTAYSLHQLIALENGEGPDAADALFTKDGLQVASLAQVVAGQITHGVGRDGRLWLYSGGVWHPDTDEKIPATVAAILGQRYRRSHLANVLDVLRYDQSVPRIDARPVGEYLNVPNGLLDWGTRTLLEHTPDSRSTVQLAVEYDPDATCPAFDDFLADVLPADCIETNFIFELIGYLLMSGNPLHVAVLLTGGGRNGKGTLLRVLLALMGERNVSSVALHDLVNNRFRVATLYGKLANIAGDLDAKYLESTALFKAITGGDQVQGEIKYGATWDFTPWAVPVFSANKPFGSPDSSEGYFSRWVVVPFPNTFAGREDPDLTARLTTDRELRGILARAAAALPALMLERGRLLEPASVAAAKHAFVVASDPVRAYLDDRADFGDGFTARTAIARDYKTWCENNDARPLSARELYLRLDTVSRLASKTINGVRGYRGLTLKENTE